MSKEKTQMSETKEEGMTLAEAKASLELNDYGKTSWDGGKAKGFIDGHRQGAELVLAEAEELETFIQYYKPCSCDDRGICMKCETLGEWAKFVSGVKKK